MFTSVPEVLLSQGTHSGLLTLVEALWLCFPNACLTCKLKVNQ